MHKIDMNPIQRALIARIKALMSASEEAAAIPHSATVGQLREKILVDFFRSLIPQSLSITSGIICDAEGRVSRQTDFIVKNDSALPSLVMSDSVAIVPIEAVHLTAEIKSNLKTEHLSKMLGDREALNALKLASYPPPSEGVDIKIPSVFMAFENEVSVDTLKTWLAEANDVVAVCVVGKFSLNKTKKGVEIYESRKGKPSHYGTIRFAELLFQFLGQSLRHQQRNPLWSAYLRGVDEILAEQEKPSA
ncbi:MAG: DUF6602 domain-containing protein [Wenzhouxiangella sp.]